jgi:hypothetical protein
MARVRGQELVHANCTLTQAVSSSYTHLHSLLTHDGLAFEDVQACQLAYDGFTTRLVPLKYTFLVGVFDSDTRKRIVAVTR